MSRPLFRVSTRLSGRLLCATVMILAAFEAAGCSRVVHFSHGRTVEVALLEYHLRPANLTGPAGALTFVVHNEGRLTHNLDITAGTTEIAATPSIPPGGEATLTVTLPAGTYVLSSSIQSDNALGEHGTLKVTP